MHLFDFRTWSFRVSKLAICGMNHVIVVDNWVFGLQDFFLLLSPPILGALLFYVIIYFTLYLSGHVMWLHYYLCLYLYM